MKYLLHFLFVFKTLTNNILIINFIDIIVKGMQILQLHITTQKWFYNRETIAALNNDIQVIPFLIQGSRSIMVKWRGTFSQCWNLYKQDCFSTVKSLRYKQPKYRKREGKERDNVGMNVRGGRDKKREIFIFI